MTLSIAMHLVLPSDGSDALNGCLPFAPLYRRASKGFMRPDGQMQLDFASNVIIRAGTILAGGQ
jgi:hypothetical protein